RFVPEVPDLAGKDLWPGLALFCRKGGLVGVFYSIILTGNAVDDQPLMPLKLLPSIATISTFMVGLWAVASCWRKKENWATRITRQMAITVSTAFKYRSAFIFIARWCA